MIVKTYGAIPPPLSTTYAAAAIQQSTALKRSLAIYLGVGTLGYVLYRLLRRRR